MIKPTSPTSAPAVPLWESRGEFQWTKIKDSFLAKLPHFDEDFRVRANQLHARWNPIHKAWTFQCKEETFFAHLDDLNTKRAQMQSQQRQLSESILSTLQQNPNLLKTSEINFSLNVERKCIDLKFSFNETLIDRVRRIKTAKWDGERKLWTVNINHITEVHALSAQIQSEVDRIDQLNAPSIEKERKLPLSKQYEFSNVVKSIDYDDVNHTYRVSLDMKIHHPLLAPFFAKLPTLFDRVPTELYPVKYPMTALRTFTVYAHTRPLLEQLFADLENFLSPLTSAMQPMSKSLTGIPDVQMKPGDIVFDNHQAFLVFSSKKTKQNIDLNVSRIPIATALTVLYGDHDIHQKSLVFSQIENVAFPAFTEACMLYETMNPFDSAQNGVQKRRKSVRI